MDYSSEDLKNLGAFVRTTAGEALKQEPSNQDGHDQLMAFFRQLEAIRFNPLLFRTLLKTYQVDYALMEEPLRSVALHINDAGILSKTIVQWRLSNGR